MDQYTYTYFEYLNALERKIKASPINLGGIIASGGGVGGPPGGYIGMLPQTRVAYDLSELALSGFVSGSPYDPSGVLISASLLDNLNHIRYRVWALEIGGPSSGVHIYNNDVLVATGVHILDFKGDFVDAVDIGGNEVEITISGKKEFIELDDVPSSYSSQANKYATVKNDETGLEFTAVVLSGLDYKTKVSADDTTAGFLEDKIVEGSNIVITSLNEGSNEDLEIAASGVSLTGHTHTESEITDLDHDAISIQGVTVSAISPTTDDVLTYDGTRWKPVVLPAGSSATRVIGFGYSTTLSGGLTLPVRMHVPWDGTITNVIATVSTAPTVSSIIIDINKNGTTIFTTQANRPTITAGTQDDLSSIPDITALVVNDILTCDIDQVGVSPGAGLVVQVRIDL